MSIRVWDVATGNCIYILSGHVNVSEAVVFYPDGTKILSGSWDGTVRIWNVLDLEYPFLKGIFDRDELSIKWFQGTDYVRLEVKVKVKVGEIRQTDGIIKDEIGDHPLYLNITVRKDRYEVKRIPATLRLDVDVDKDVCDKINQQTYDNIVEMIVDLLNSFGQRSGPSVKKQRVEFKF
jgi:hypothetical protein